jgi:hypothetical protein
MEDRLVARYSMLKLCFMGLFLLAFLIMFVVGPERFGLTPKPDFELIRWPFAALFAWLTFVAGRKLFDDREQIVVGANGISIQFTSPLAIPWSAIARIAVAKQYVSLIVYRRNICLYLHDPARYPMKTGRARLFGRLGNLGYGDITVPTAGLDRGIDEIIAAIEPRATAAGIALTRE